MTFMSDNNSTVNMDGALGEVVIVMDTSDDTRERMEGYLAHKWGLTDNLPPGHRYKSTAPSVFQPGSGSIFRFR